MNEVNEQSENIATRKTVMRSVAYEEVISYRQTFISYWATPLYVVCIIVLLMATWFVKVPTQKTTPLKFTWNKAADNYSTSPIGNIRRDIVPAIQLKNARLQGVVAQNGCIVLPAKDVKAGLWGNPTVFEATVTYGVPGEPLLLKLWNNISRHIPAP